MRPYETVRTPYADTMPSSDRKARRVVRRQMKRGDKFRVMRRVIQEEEEEEKWFLIEMIEMQIDLGFDTSMFDHDFEVRALVRMEQEQEDENYDDYLYHEDYRYYEGDYL